MNNGRNIAAALEEWRGILGDGALTHHHAALEAAGRTTFAAGHAPVAVLCPQDRDQVAACVRAAALHGVPLYPVSRGRNWGFGSKACPRPGMALMDLGAMDRITGFDADLGTLCLQPGTSFAQVDRFLRRQKARFYLPAIGGAAQSSVIGNALERGEAFGPGGDRAGETYDLEMVLGTGEIVHSAFSRFRAEGAAFQRLAQAHKRAIGPNLDGLVQQGNFAIVTGATVALTPLPEFTISLVGRIGTSDKLPAAIHALRSLLREDIVAPYAMSIWNQCKILARDALFREVPASALSRDALDSWSVSMVLTAPNAMMAEARTRTAGMVLNGLLEETQILRDRDEKGERIPTILTGTPDDRNLRSLYWRKDHAPENEDYDPDRDRCGVLWLCPAIPFTGEDVVRAVKIMNEAAFDFGFEPNIGLHALSHRCFNAFLALVYDRDAPGEDERAMACHDRAAEELIAAGYLPYRQGLQGIPAMPEDDAAGAFGAIKRALDPHGIIAPGRYEGFQGARHGKGG